MIASPTGFSDDPVGDLFTMTLSSLQERYKSIMQIEKALEAGDWLDSREEQLLHCKDVIRLRIKEFEDQHTSLVSSQVCAEELTSPKPTSILSPKQLQNLEEQFNLFLHGYIEDGRYLYKEYAKSVDTSSMYIHYKHLDRFDPELAKTVRMFYKSVRTSINSAIRSFLNEVRKDQWESTTFKICDVPGNSSFIPLKEFWSLHGHNPSEEEDICCGKTTLRITKTTPSGRIPLLNLLLRIFSDHGSGLTWDGEWDINDVMVNESYDVEIWKPHAPRFTKRALTNDFIRFADEVLPELSCGGRLPAFFKDLGGRLRKLLNEQPYITCASWKKFFELVTTHLALKAPLKRSTLYDNVHEMKQTLGKTAQALFIAILNTEGIDDWLSSLEDKEDPNPILSVVYSHNLKKKAKNLRKDKARVEEPGKTESEQEEISAEMVGVNPQAEEAEQSAEMVGVNCHAEQAAKSAEMVGANYQAEVAEKSAEMVEVNCQPEQAAKSAKMGVPCPFNDTVEGILVFTRHVKQHGSKGTRDVKGNQSLKRLSQVDLVASHYLESLPAIHFALIYSIDAQFEYDEADHDAIVEMLNEILKEYNNSLDGSQYRDLVRPHGEMVVVWSNIDCDCEEKFQIIDDYFSTRSYINGLQFSRYDITAFRALETGPPEKFVNFKNWYEHISSILRNISGDYHAEGDGGVHAEGNNTRAVSTTCCLYTDDEKDWLSNGADMMLKIAMQLMEVNQMSRRPRLEQARIAEDDDELEQARIVEEEDAGDDTRSCGELSLH